MLEEIRRPIRIDDWNRMVDEFNKLTKRVKELEERIPEPKKEWETLVYDKFLVNFDEFFREPGAYIWGTQVQMNIEDKQTYQYLKNIYVFDKDMMKDIEKLLSENKCINVTVNINEKEISTKKVAIKWNVDKVDVEKEPEEVKPKRKQGRPKKKRWWFWL